MAETTAVQPGVRVSTIELFFDLVFVFTVTQLTTVLVDAFTPDRAALGGLVRVMLMLGVIWWMYGGYAWLTNSVAPTDSYRRGLLLVGMGSFLVIALAIPRAFGAAGWAFGLGYMLVNLVHSGLFGLSGAPGVTQAIRRLAPLNFASATLVLAGGLAPVHWRYPLWAAAMALQIASPYLHPIGGFSISPAHFVERHGLVLIIALGESVVAIGVGAASVPFTVQLIGVAVLGLTLAYLLYWTYFGVDNDQAEHALNAIGDPVGRARAALRGYGYAYYPMLLGIVMLAAGIKKAVGHINEHLAVAPALALAGGLALFLLGDVAFRAVMHIGWLRYRAVAAVLALATVPLGAVASGVELGALVLVLAGLLGVERFRDTGTLLDRPPGGRHDLGTL